jgi:hypothetical protein
MTSLNNLTDQDLLDSLHQLVRQEHDVTLDIVRHLVEVERRRLYAGKAYNSLFEYCRGEFGYTDASAWRRAGAAMSIYKCPQAWGLLETGQVTLTALAKVWKVITPELLTQICGRSLDEVELILSVHSSGGANRDKTRPVMVPRKAEVECDAEQDRPAADSSTPAARPLDTNTADDPGASPLRREVSLTNIKLEFEQRWKVEGVVSERVKQKLDKCKSLLSSKYPNGVDYDALFDELTEVFLDKADPERRIERRQKRNGNNKKTGKTAVTTGSETDQTRHVPSAVKDEVWVNYHGQCAYVGPNGKRCNSTHNLQFDHYPIPFARGGPSTADNLRLLCAKHNRFTAEKIFGKRDYNKQPAAGT